MRLVKAVTREFFEQVEDIVGPLFRNVIGVGTAFDKDFALLRHLLRILLTHRAAQQVGRAQTVAGQQVGGLLNLLLVNQNTVGFAAYILQQRVQILDFLPAFFAVDEVRDQLHRTGTVECNQRNDVVDGVHAEVPAQIGHAAGFQLEYRDGCAPAQQLKTRRVIERDVFNTEARRVPVNQLHRIIDNG